MVNFQNDLISSLFTVFRAVFRTEQVLMIWRRDLERFFGILFLKGYSFCMMADFQNGLISRVFSVSSRGFVAQNNCK